MARWKAALLLLPALQSDENFCAGIEQWGVCSFPQANKNSEMLLSSQDSVSLGLLITFKIIPQSGSWCPSQLGNHIPRQQTEQNSCAFWAQCGVSASSKHCRHLMLGKCKISTAKVQPWGNMHGLCTIKVQLLLLWKKLLVPKKLLKTGFVEPSCPALALWRWEH